jgi:hypothetical protein
MNLAIVPCLMTPVSCNGASGAGVRGALGLPFFLDFFLGGLKVKLSKLLDSSCKQLKFVLTGFTTKRYSALNSRISFMLY